MRASMTAILLAAGAGKRFGSQKLLARLPDGRYVVEAAAKNLLAGAGHVIAVTGRDDRLMKALDDCGCQVVVNIEAEQGMGSSIAAGVRASADAAVWLIALGDMPYIQPETIASVLKALDGATGIVIPTFGGQRGHPVAFAGAFGSELIALQGDNGARRVVAAHADQVKLLPVDDAGVLMDIDTSDDLQAVFPRHQP
jgi:molybdenum cofactor cytidylyltransferase